MLKIEPVKMQELPLLASLRRKTFYDTFYKQNTEEDMQLFLNSTLNEQILENEMNDESTHFFFARSNDEVAGFLKLSTAPFSLLAGKQVLEIGSIYVSREKIGSGVGKALMEFAISFARQLHKTTVYLGVWEHNARAIAFYKSFGFVKFDEHIFMVGNDPQTDWWMKMKI